MTGFARWNLLLQLGMSAAPPLEVYKAISANLFNRMKTAVASAFSPSFAPALA